MLTMNDSNGEQPGGMNSPEESSVVHESPDDERLFGVLDAYVASLQTGDESAADVDLPDEVLERYPELAAMLDCLDSLETVRGSWSGVVQESETPTMAASDPAGRRAFGEYELLEEIGRGGMGVVYRARHKTLQADVALKLIRGSQLAGGDELRRFYQEARVAAGLSHPRIVRVRSVGEHDGQHFLAMDLVEGPNLASLTAEERSIEPSRTAEMIAEIARAVQYLHENGFIHRDLKPSNILLDSAGCPHLTDFGLIKLVAADQKYTVSGTIIGTPDYMSPEQARGHSAKVTPLSDIYGLGALMYELLTGRPPFHEESPLDTLLGVLEREPLLPHMIVPAVPRELEQICLKCLEKQPERRYQSAADLADELERYLKGEPVRANAPGMMRRVTRWARRQPGLASRWAGLGLGAAIVQVNYWLSTGESPNHLAVMGALAAWAGLSYVLQQLQSRTSLEGAVSYAWAAVDAVLYTTLVHLAEGPHDVLAAGYPLLIAASGLWFRVRLVVSMTVVCLGAWVWLVQTGHVDPKAPSHYVWLVCAVLMITGAAVGYQVYRVRTLNRYFERQTQRISGR